MPGWLARLERSEEGGRLRLGEGAVPIGANRVRWVGTGCMDFCGTRRSDWQMRVGAMHERLRA